jgi:hypothetical protein
VAAQVATSEFAVSGGKSIRGDRTSQQRRGSQSDKIAFHLNNSIR